MSVYEAEIAAWRRAHEDDLAREDGWLAQIELHVLGDEPLVLAIGTFAACAAGARFQPAPGQVVTLARSGSRGSNALVEGEVVLADEGGVLASGGRRYELVCRGGRRSVRVRDPEAPARRAFRGLRWYPIDPAWRIVGRLEREAHASPMRFTGGEEEDAPCPGRVAFEVGGVPLALVPYARAGGELLFVFRDETNDDATYALCRYFYAPPPDEAGHVVLDFNKAAAPICALVPAVTCVLPPPENRLPVRVEAGERRA